MDSLRDDNHGPAGTCCWYALDQTEEPTGAMNGPEQYRITNELAEGHQQRRGKQPLSPGNVASSLSSAQRTSCAVGGGSRVAARLRKASLAMASGAADVPDDSLIMLQAPFKLCHTAKLAELQEAAGSTAKRSDKVRLVSERMLYGYLGYC